MIPEKEYNATRLLECLHLLEHLRTLEVSRGLLKTERAFLGELIAWLSRRRRALEARAGVAEKDA